MSKKSIKRYLMLLAAIGLVAFASGGAGTFASFNAEVTNTGNYFATGTLILNDNGGTNTCTSAGALLSNHNSGTDCDTLFKLDKFTFGATSLTTPTLTSGDGASAVIAVAAVTGATIYTGDTLTISQGANSDSLPVVSGAAIGGTSLTVDASGISNSYTSGATITDNNETALANLTLSNAGTIDASGISFQAGGTPCTSQYREGHSTLNMGTVTLHASSGTTLTFSSITAGAFHAGDPVVVSQSGHANAFIAASTSTATQVTVTAAQPWNFAYTTAAVVAGPEFNGGSSHALCSSLKFSATEADSSFNPDLSGAVGCAYGSTTAPVAPNACDFGASTALSSVPSTLTALTLGTGAGTGNSGVKLSAGGKRYFILAVHYTGPSFDNTYQNTEATAFDLTWHIDQA
jgi:hypothetical protein